MRRILTLVVLAGGLSALPVAPAAETPPAATNAGEDPIAAAKKEFERAKAERASGGESKSGLPRVEVPALSQPSLGTSPLTPGAQKKNENRAAKEKKSANWLLEAMERPADTRDVRGNRGAGDPASENARGLAREATTDFSGAAAQPEAAETGDRERTASRSRSDATARTEDEPRRAEPPPNPLARFMGEWMTPQDYALMKPVVDAPRPGEAPAMTSTPGNVPESLAGPMEISGEGRANARTAFTSNASVENPYLQLLNTPPPSAAPVSAAPAPVSNTAPVILAPPTPAPEPAKSKIPDFAKPLDDQKLFKQLKRF